MSVVADFIFARPSSPAPAATRASALTDRHVPLWVVPLVGLFVLAIYAVGYDQGLLLYPLFGEASMKANVLHEFVHDGRHLLAFACH
jgi:Probable cobalt transporter subunit (CbtB)